MKIRAGVGISSWPFPRREADQLWAFVDACEASDVDSIWISDRVVSNNFGVESICVMAALAGRTRRIKFGNSVLVLPLRNPTLLAKEIATIDFLSGGRVLPAVGLGGENREELEAMGATVSQRAGRTDEAIVLMRKLWTEDSVTFHGKYYNATAVHIEPRTVAKPCPPIWIGGRSEAALRRVGRLGDGWLASSVSTSEVRAGVEAIRGFASQAGRAVPEDHYGVILPFYLAANHEDGLARARVDPGRGRQDPKLEEHGAFGPPEEIVRRVKEYALAGATKFVLRAAGPPDDVSQQTRLVAAEVIPTLHRL